MNESYSHLDKIESIFNLGAFVILICYPYLLSLFVILGDPPLDTSQNNKQLVLI